MKTDIKFARAMVKYIKSNFTDYHLTGNTAKNISYKRINPNQVKITMDAPRYSTYTYVRKGVIRTLKGYYASDVDRHGGKVMGRNTTRHINFIDGSIITAVSKDERMVIVQWH